jgi:predicted DNA-binding WGR domain protein
MKTTTLYFQNATSNKTYFASLAGSIVTLMWGKIDGELQGFEYTCDSRAEADEMYRTKIAEKLEKGYQTYRLRGIADKPVVEKPVAKKASKTVVSITDNAWRGPAAVTAWVKIRRIKAIAEAKGITYAQAAEIDARNQAKTAGKGKGKKAA